MGGTSESNVAFLDGLVTDADIDLFLGCVATCIGSDDEEDIAEAMDLVVSDFCDQEAIAEMGEGVDDATRESYLQTYDDKSAQISNMGAQEQARYILASLLKAGNVELPLSAETAQSAVKETGWFGEPLGDDLEFYIES
jgi:hypothetical protein